MSNSTKRSRKYRNDKARRYAAPVLDKEESDDEEDSFNRKPVKDGEEDSTLGNGVGKPRAEKSVNPIVEHLNEQESTTRDSAYYSDSLRKPYNPDDLVMRRQDYSIYDRDMPNDDQVSVCLELKKDLILGSGYEFVIENEAEPEDEDEPVAPAEGKKPPKPAVDALKDPKVFAFPPKPGAAPAVPPPPMVEESPEEEEARVAEEEAGAAKEAERKAKTNLMLTIKKDLEVAFAEDPDRDIDESFEEMLTAFENGFSLTEKVWKKRDDGSYTIKSLKTRHPSSWLIHTDEQGNVSKYEQRSAKGSISVKPTALIHYVNNPRYQNPYGRSDLRAAYDAWFIKREIIKYYAIFLEKGASPTPIGKYPKNTPPEQVTELYNVIKKFQTKTAMVVPVDVEIDFLEAKSNGEAYVKAINIFNMFIGRALFIPDLLGFQGSETSGGSYSLGKDQINILYKHVQKRRARFEKLINIHLVKPFVLTNYGDVDKFPKFRLKEISDENAEKYAKLWIEAIKGKFYEPSDDEINYFRRLIKFPAGPVERAAPPPVAPMLPDGSPNPAHPAQGATDDVSKEKAPVGKNPSGEGSGSDGAKPSATTPPKAGAGEKRDFARAFDGTPGDYAKKVNFKLLKSGLDSSFARIMDEGNPLIRELYDDLFQQIRDKKLITKQSVEKIDALKIKKLPELKRLLKRRFLDLRNDIYKQSTSEIVKGAKAYATPLPHEKFLAFLEEETDQYLGDFEYNIKKKSRVAIINAIKDGKPLSDVLDVLDDEGVKLSTVSLERFARTKLTEVMNRARKEAFEETGVVAAYQFTAIMDDRVSEICGGLHGCIFEMDDAPTPPLHFNCRSVLIPITKYEKYTVTKSTEGMNIDKFIDENIGEGFSRQ